MFRNNIVLLITIVFFSCRKDEPLVPIKTGFDFVVIGHAYGNPLNFQLNLYKKLIPELKSIHSLIQPNQYIFTGDLVAKATEENWTNVLNQFDSLNLPYWIAPGNHDISSDYFINNVQSDLFFSRREGRNLFLMLNSNFKGWTINSPQISLISNELTDLDDIDNIFVFTHHVWWMNETDASLEFDSLLTNSIYFINGPSNFWTDAFPLFEVLDKQTYFFAGDVGAYSFRPSYQETHFDNLHFYASGVGGGIDDNFLFVKVSESGEVSVDKVNF